MSICTFNDCENNAIPGSVKCAFHKNRRQCKAKECNNQVYARNLCVRHGGKKQCHFDGCDSYARGGNYCIQHGGIVVKRFCTVEGCTKQAHAKQLCVRHGGGRLCRTAGCQHHAREGGLCHKHNQGGPKYDGMSSSTSSSAGSCTSGSAPSSPKKEFPVVKTETSADDDEVDLSSYMNLECHTIITDDDIATLPLLAEQPQPPTVVFHPLLDTASVMQQHHHAPATASTMNAAMYNKWLQLTQDVLWTLHPDLMGISYAGLLPTAAAVHAPLLALPKPATVEFDKDPALFDPLFTAQDTPLDLMGLDHDLLNAHDVFSGVLA
ncbi:Aste57867_19029 [Aphanomyces stellatus]|uniref:Aste57867_19029 protein n=1 Tax=Aphanomyces stellatus TaxID=120398 RepID=A0A485LBT3_9STRA|nr:hypothetical protein As57867_018965 [Aphanomyces stellatus]VFT95754.1 Aste57867_19029 [Aphanomyces stellatus]